MRLRYVEYKGIFIFFVMGEVGRKGDGEMEGEWK